MDERLRELREKAEDQEKKIAAKKEDLGRVIGELAVKESSENEENLKSCKKALERMTETLDETKAMILSLEIERGRLSVEMAEAEIREIPNQLEELCRGFNNLLDEGIVLLEGIETLHKKLQATQADFFSLSNKRSNALSKLGRMEGLVISEGLGKLSQVGSPHGQSFSVPTEVGLFISTLKRYREALENFEKFQKDNPNFKEDVEKTTIRDKENQKPFMLWSARPWQV